MRKYYFFFTLLFSLLFTAALYAQSGFTITESLRNSSTEQLTLGGDAYLTAGVHDEEGQGWLRLTEAEGNQAGYAVINQSFPSSLGVLLDLEFIIWGGNGADGFSFFLFDANYDPNPVGTEQQFQIGGFGGSLGYANRSVEEVEAGVTGGYIGVGVDRYGNYANTHEGKNGGAVTGSELRPNSIGIRGPENPGGELPYRWLDGNTDLENTLGLPGFTLDISGFNSRPTAGQHYRRIQLEIRPDPDNDGQYIISARMKVEEDGDFVQVLDPFLIDDVPPAMLKMGFAASTGGQNNIHEVRNLIITTPGGVRVHKEVDKPAARVGDQLTYTVNLYNQENVVAPNLDFNDFIPDYFEVIDITFDNDGNSGNTAIGWDQDELTDVTVNLAPYGEARFIITGTVTGVPPSGEISNTATFKVTTETGFSDPDPENDESTVTTQITDPAIQLVKTSTFDVGTDGMANPGDEITYTFTATNVGDITLTDIIITEESFNGTGVLPIPTFVNSTANSPEGTLTPGESATYTAVYQITQADIEAGGVSNQALVTGTPPVGDPVTDLSGTDPDDPDNDEETETDIPQQPNLSFVKTVSLTDDVDSNGEVSVDDILTYTFTVTNTGNVTVDNVTITDTDLDGLGTLSYSWPDGDNAGVLLPGEAVTATATYTVTQADVDAGGVSNQALVTGTPPGVPGEPGEPLPPVPSTPDEENPGVPGGPGVPTEIDIPQDPSILITKTSREGRYAEVGDVITYDITVRNTGNVTLSDIAITDDNADAGSITPAAVASLAPGESVDATATHTVIQSDVDAGYVYNLAKATGNTPDGDQVEDESHDPDPKDPEAPVDPACPDCTITPIQAQPAVALVKEVTNSGTGRDGLFVAGDGILYTFTVHNTGNVSLGNFRLTDARLGLDNVLVEGTLPPGGTLTHRARYTVTQADIAAGEVVNTAAVGADTPDGETVTDVSGTSTENDTPTVISVAGGPESADDAVSTPQHTPVTIDILDNDREGSSPLDPSTVRLLDPGTGEPAGEVTIPGEGTYRVEADGRVTFTPERGFSGQSSVRYVVRDENGLPAGPATVTVTVAASRPRAGDDRAETAFSTPVRIPVLDNDQADGAPLDPASVEIIDQPGHGTVTVNPDGTVTYTPNQYYTGTDRFTYRVRDENGNWTNVAAVEVTVSGFRIPNVITPNGDGLNDRFVIVGLEDYDHAGVTIFNRWGNEVYRSGNYRNDWAGQGVNEGTYYYLITLRRDGRETVHKGWVLVKRN